VTQALPLMTMLEVLTWPWLVFTFAFGATVGSFLNVCIHRIPADESVVRPRSRCPGCRTLIAWYDNIPIVSWLLLRARCRSCGIRIAARYPLVEAIAGLCCRYVECVIVNLIDLRKRFDEVNGVAFVSSKLCANGMSVDCDPHSLIRVPLFGTRISLNSGYLLRLAGASGLRVFTLLAASIALANAGCLAAQSTQVVKLGASDASSFHEIDVINDRGV